MVAPSVVLAISAAYLLVLFAVAAFGDRRAAQGRSIIGNPWIYAFSWAVYCSAWTYFGSVGRAATGGLWFLPIYLGPMLAMLLAWLLLRKMVRIARTYRITSIADFIASRYGKSPLLAASVTLITVIGIVPYIALQLKGLSAGYDLLINGAGNVARDAQPWWRSDILAVTLALAAFTILFGTRHLDTAERHEGMVAAIAFESAVKLAAFLAVGIFVTFVMFDGPADIWSRAQDLPDIEALFTLSTGAGVASTAYTQWFALIVLAMLSVLVLPRQFQMMVVECVDERYIRRSAWIFALYLLLINIFVLPLAVAGLVHFGGASAVDPETFVLSLPLSDGATVLALIAYVGGLSAATGMLIVETIAVSTMVCNDLVMPMLLRLTPIGARATGDVTRLVLNIRRAAIISLLLLGYVYFRIAGDAYALVSIGLISFAAVAQFAPALLAGIYWRGGTALGAMGGLLGGFAVWAYTLMLPSMAKSGWLPADFLDHGPFGIRLLAPEHLFGLTGLDNLTHSLFWSMLVNLGLYFGLSLWRQPSAREASQALLFVDVFDRGADADEPAPIFWRGRARLEDLVQLANRLLGQTRAAQMLEDHAREVGVADVGAITADARLVDRVERQIAGAVGSASARVMVASVVQEEPLGITDVMEILDEASELRGYARALEEKSRSLEEATEELRGANVALQSLDHMKDDFMSSMTHELRTPLTSIRALSELMLDVPDMDAPQREEFLRIMVSESERLSRLVNQVLDMAKMDSGHAEWHSADVDMRQLVSESVHIAAELFREHHADLILDVPDHVPVIRADPDRLKQVMLNLLSNAAKFVPEEGGRVDVSLGIEGDGLLVKVRDNGPGIPEDQQAAVFERFQQAGDAASRPAGTGLGLPISRRIVEHFGGELWVESVEGGGACFAFRLPLRHEGEEQDHERQGADR